MSHFEPIQNMVEGVPYIRGDFTNWKPVKMVDIREFCDILDTNKPTLVEIA